MELGFDPVELRSVTGGGAFFPPGTRWQGWSDFGTQYARMLPVPGGLLMRLEDAAGRGKIVSARHDGGGHWTVSAPFDPHPGWPSLFGLRATPPSALGPTTYVAWNITDGRLVGIQLDPATLAPFEVAVTPRDSASRLDCVAYPDVNADGAPDLLAVGQFVQTADLFLGDGASDLPLEGPAFGGRVHYRGMGLPAVAGDLDGDGALDLLAYGGGALSTYFGVDGQLAFGERLTTILPMGVAIGKLFGSQDSFVFHDHQQGFYAMHGRGDGTFDPVAPLTAVQADGTTPFVDPVYALNEVRLGGPALLSQGQVFLARDGKLVAVATPSMGAGYSTEKCAFLPAARIEPPATTATVLAACSESDVASCGNRACALVVRRATLHLDAVPPAFDDWVEVLRTASPYDEDLVVMNSIFGTAQLLEGKAYFVARFPTSGKLSVITLDAAGTTAREDVVAAPGAFERNTFNVAPALPLRGPGEPSDVVVSNGRELLVLRRDTLADRFRLAQTLLGGAGFPLAVGPLSPGGPPVLLTSGFALFAGDIPSEVVPVAIGPDGLLR